MARYVDADKIDELIENRKVKGDCKFCNKYERCIKNGINRKGSHLYCWEKIELPTADVVEVARCEKCKYRKTHTCAITGIETLFCDYGDKPIAVQPTHFCSYGERRDT